MASQPKSIVLMHAMRRAAAKNHRVQRKKREASENRKANTHLRHFERTYYWKKVVLRRIRRVSSHPTPVGLRLLVEIVEDPNHHEECRLLAARVILRIGLGPEPRKPRELDL